MRSSLPRTAAVPALVSLALAAGLIVTATPASAADVRIHGIQGTTRISPLVGSPVADVPGIVTGVRAYGSSRGFWFQDPKPDNDPATSEGLFVYTGSSPTVKVGDSVQVAGTVSEFVPGGAATGEQSVTELTSSNAKVTVVSSGNALPAPVRITAKSVPAAYAPAGTPATGNSVNGLRLKPKAYALDYYESLEGMNVSVANTRVVGATDAFAELWVTVKPSENADRRGGTVYGSYDEQNTGRVQIQQQASTTDHAFPVANVGDQLKGTTEGPLDFNQFGGYTLVAGQLGTVVDKGLKREVTAKQKKDQLAVSTYNVENLAPSDPQSKFDSLASAVVTNLSSPDILSLEEIQDDSGATDDGTVTAGVTVQKFIDAIAAHGGPTYAWRSVAPENDKDGGQPGGNIRNVFLYNPARVSFVDRGTADATTGTQVVSTKNGPDLTLSPGRLDPANPAWTDSRKPLVGEFTFQGRTVFLVSNHFISKGGDESLTSQHQPGTRSSEVQRQEQAAAVNSFVKDVRKVKKDADVVVLGDLNDFQFSGTLATLTKGGVLDDDIDTLPVPERYSYVYNGNTQTLDHILTTPSITDFQYDSVHINAEFAQQDSDHDPQVLRLRP
ncbi:endonuclease/exonuclease/phosphatase family protein [Streptomyces fuscigenes]|uniref:endonuclease/exonuclease/phosphatase family protein n=1 Tax=Streptomyces fuscigenes TaxID=1528880 RepID=UPI001F3B9A60|nr:endonuclease/exonuclease/phosphatase family protein [Streptomyces fuscigenes]MCF3962006.1 endonuclease/exonuclease/phosphatase family protein [Streptomyces fuscigenes]